jgi:hypothetical protein
MRKAVITGLLLFIFCGAVSGAFAQNTGIGGGAGSNEANCDLCGYCKGQPAPQSWEKCRSCLYPGVGASTPEDNQTLIGLPTPLPDKHYTSVGCLSTDPGQFASQMSTFFFSIVGGIAFLYLIYGAGIIATSRADAERLNHGKRVVWGSIIGLLFVLFSVFIIRFIVTSLGVPGFGG